MAYPRAAPMYRGVSLPEVTALGVTERGSLLSPSSITHGVAPIVRCRTSPSVLFSTLLLEWSRNLAVSAGRSAQRTVPEVHRVPFKSPATERKQEPSLDAIADCATCLLQSRPRTKWWRLAFLCTMDPNSLKTLRSAHWRNFGRRDATKRGSVLTAT